MDWTFGIQRFDIKLTTLAHDSNSNSVSKIHARIAVAPIRAMEGGCHLMNISIYIPKDRLFIHHLFIYLYSIKFACIVFLWAEQSSIFPQSDLKNIFSTHKHSNSANSKFPMNFGDDITIDDDMVQFQKPISVQY